MPDTTFTILLIEDNRLQINIIRRILQKPPGHSFTLHVAEKLQEGLELISREPIDAVLLDLNLPDSEGVETLTAVTEQSPELPVVVLTAMDDEETAVDAVKHGAQDYLYKGKADQDLLVRSLRYAIERKQVHERLKTSEQRYRMLVENINDIVFNLDEQNCFSYISPVVETSLGIVPEELIGKPFVSIVESENEDIVQAAIDKASIGFSDTLRFRVRMKDGPARYMRASGRPVSSPEKSAAGFTGIMVDVTERVLALEALNRANEELEERVAERTADLAREREQLLSIFSSINEIIYVSDPDTYEILYVNPAAEARFGASLIGSICYERLMGRTAPCEFCTNDVILENRYEPYQWEFHNPALDRDFMVADRIIQWPDGRDVRFSLSIDITDRIKAVRRIAESEQKWRGIFEKSRDVIFISTVNGDIVDVNPAGLNLLGFDANDIKNMSVYDIYNNPKDRLRFQRKIERDGFINDFEAMLKKRDGTTLDSLITATVMTDPDGGVVGYQGIIKDFTKRKRSVDITLDSVADGVFVIDTEHIVTFCNAAAQKLFEIPRHDIIGASIDHILPALDERLYHTLLNSLKSGREVGNQELTITLRDGRKIPVSFGISPLRDEETESMWAVVTLRDIQTIRDLKKEISGQYTFEDIVSKNREIREIFDIMPHLAETDTTVLIEGKSGTGKELFARAIHNLSRRREGPFVAVNCAALPENLLESELFGHVKGAFTDAVRDKPGRFTRAQGGTILLDEIAELPLSLQGKLLRVLQEREYEPLGSITSMQTDARIITCTNKDLASEVAHGNFREDLFYRLNVVNLAIPPLKDRREDIPLLVEHFIDKISRKLGADHLDVSEDFMNFLMNYDFPGNVRELENIIEHAYVLCRGPAITTDYLPRELKSRVVGTIGDDQSLREQQEETERRHIEEALIRFSGNKTKTARALNMNRSTLWRKMKRYQMLQDDR